MKIFSYKFLNLPLLHKFNALEILEGKKFISLDLGISKEEVEIDKNSVRIRSFEVPLEEIKKIAEDKRNNIFALTHEKPLKLLFFEENVYKLRLVKPDTAPTLEINGIHMHRIKNTTPWEDSLEKVKVLDARGKRVLDICTGLGYTAILSGKLGAREIITIEKDENVLKVAEFNPWSKGLEKIKIINEDAFSVLDRFEEKSFDRILLDPPRESLARELYSRTFYSKLKKVLTKKGKLFHYVGKVGIKKKRKFWIEIKKRLRDSKFSSVKFEKKALGLIAEK